MAKVKKIPATISRVTAEPLGSVKKRKVAGYARVSTDNEEQQTSYEAQMDYYSKYIASRDDWEFVKMYSDEGISATSTKHRAGFNAMIEDALAGKIDLIITKSISRFARNTVDSLTAIRKLKENGTEVFFEKENIWTFDARGELLITIMSSLAQEESRSISENTTWGRRKAFADGNYSLPWKSFYGYDKGEDGKPVINPKQAEVIRLIYKMFLEGYSAQAIANALYDKGIKSPMGKDRWNTYNIMYILQNEKMCGNALLQKKYTDSFLTKKQIKNNGEIPQYLVEDDHEGIIDKRTWELVQAEVQCRKGKHYSGVSIFSSKIVCGECGGFYGQKIWHSNDKYRKIVWRCNHKYKEHGRSAAHCKTPTLTEDEIKAAFVKAMNIYLGNKDEIIRNIEAARKILCDTSELEKEKAAQAEEMNIAAELIHKAMDENARRAQDQDEYERKYVALDERYRKAEEAYRDAGVKILEQGARNRMLCQMIRKLKSIDGPVEEFDADLWGVFIEKITVMRDGSMVVLFRDGTEEKV